MPILFGSTVAALLVYAFLLSYWTPFTGDCFMHSVFGAEHRLSFGAVAERCWWSYLHWNPRLGEFLAFFTATAGKWLFCLINPFVILSLVWMMFYLAMGRGVNRRSGRDVFLFALCALLLVTASSRPGITMFWLSGSTNYAWAAAVWMGGLCLYRSLWAGTSRLKDKPLTWLLIGVAGFIAGMTNENQVPASMGMLSVFWLAARVGKKPLPVWFYVGWLAHLAGGLCLLLAPGNTERMQSVTAGGAEVLTTWAERFNAMPVLLNALYEFMLIPQILLLAGLIALACLWKKCGRALWQGETGRRLWVALLFIAVAHGMAISFFVRVIPAWHAMFSATVLFMTGVIGIYGVLTDRGNRPWLPVGIMALGGAFCFKVCLGYLAVFPVIHRQCEERKAFVRQELAAGKTNIVVEPYAPVHPAPYVSIMWRMSSSDPTEFINASVAKYLGIETIRVRDEKEN